MRILNSVGQQKHVRRAEITQFQLTHIHAFHTECSDCKLWTQAYTELIPLWFKHRNMSTVAIYNESVLDYIYLKIDCCDIAYHSRILYNSMRHVRSKNRSNKLFIWKKMKKLINRSRFVCNWYCTYFSRPFRDRLSSRIYIYFSCSQTYGRSVVSMIIFNFFLCPLNGYHSIASPVTADRISKCLIFASESVTFEWYERKEEKKTVKWRNKK